MLVTLECGCRINDEHKSTAHDASPERSTRDQQLGKHHYWIGTSGKTFCMGCDLHRPCMCDKTVAPDIAAEAPHG